MAEWNVNKLQIKLTDLFIPRQRKVQLKQNSYVNLCQQISSFCLERNLSKISQRKKVKIVQSDANSLWVILNLIYKLLTFCQSSENEKSHF